MTNRISERDSSRPEELIDDDLDMAQGGASGLELSKVLSGGPGPAVGNADLSQFANSGPSASSPASGPSGPSPSNGYKYNKYGKRTR